MTLSYYEYEVAISDFDSEIVHILTNSGDKAYRSIWQLIHNYFHTYPDALIFNFVTKMEASEV